MKTKEELAAYSKKYYEANKERIREHNRHRYETDPVYRENTKQRSMARYRKMSGHTDIGVLPGKKKRKRNKVNKCGTCIHISCGMCILTGIGVQVDPYRLACPHYVLGTALSNASAVITGGAKSLLEYKRSLNCSVCAYANEDNTKVLSCTCPKGKMCNDGMLEWLLAPSGKTNKDQ